MVKRIQAMQFTYMKIKSISQLSLLVSHYYQFMYLSKDKFIICSTHIHSYTHMYILYTNVVLDMFMSVIIYTVYTYTYKSFLVIKMVTAHFTLLLNNMWWIRDAYKFFAIPPIESWSFFLLTLNRALHVTYLTNKMWQKWLYNFQGWILTCFAASPLHTWDTPFWNKMSHSKNPKTYGALDNNPSQHQQPSTWVSHFGCSSPR